MWRTEREKLVGRAASVNYYFCIPVSISFSSLSRFVNTPFSTLFILPRFLLLNSYDYPFFFSTFFVCTSILVTGCFFPRNFRRRRRKEEKGLKLENGFSFYEFTFSPRNLLPLYREGTRRYILYRKKTARER